MKLFIDTSSNQRTVVKLGDLSLKKDSSTWHSQVVLPMIQTLLKKSDKTVKDITEIEVNTGPGSFTGLRVGVAIANALGFALKVPVNGKNVSKLTIVKPRYTP